jgi:hypothetical protein
MPKSTTYANTILDALLGSGAPATLYIGLYTASPNPDGTGGTEVTGGSYARVAVTNDATHWPAAAGGSKHNALAVTFATATANWGSVVAAGIFAAISGGTPYYFDDLDDARTVNNGDGFSFAPTQVVINES